MFRINLLILVAYSDHAKRRMKQRGIEEWEIEHLLSHPSYTRKTFEGKTESVGEIRNRNVKIVSIKEEKYIKIVTVV